MRFAHSITVPLVAALALTVTGCSAGNGDEKSSAPAELQKKVAAYLGDESIPQEDVDNMVAGELAKLREQMYEQRRAALERIVAEKLVNAEAAAQGITAEEYFKNEVLSKIPDPSDEEVKQFFDRNKNRIKDFQTRSYEDLKEPIRQNIKQIKVNAVRDQLIANLEKKAGFRLVMEPPRVDVPVPAGEPKRGPGNAPITLVEFSDYQCPYCKRAHPVLERLMEEYGDKIQLIYRDYPLAFHKNARPAAVAARCAGDQGKYWEFNKSFMEKNGALDRTDFVSRAETIGMDMNAFNTCLDSGKYDTVVEASFKDGAKLGVTGTPTFFVNGRMMVGVAPYEKMKAMIDEELARKSASTPKADS